MLADLRLLLSSTAQNAEPADYAAAILHANVLAKPTRKARELALRHLTVLYALDQANPIFRALRRLWPLNEAAQPLLALSMALARDPLLRCTQTFILSLTTGTTIRRSAVEAHLSQTDPERFSAASLKSLAQNVAGSWTASGHLRGHVTKTRIPVHAQPESITLLLFLGYLEGRTGQRLFSSSWMNLIDGSLDELETLANSASHRGLLVFMSAGGVQEVRFPGYLSPQEDRIRHEVSHVV